MRTLFYGQKRINIVENENDLREFAEFVSRNRKALAYDTETTGLDIYSAGFRVRLAQFGTDRESYVVPVEKGPRYVWYVKRSLEVVENLICHNAKFDILVAVQHFGNDLKDLFDKAHDTYIYSHLVDSREYKEGGTGHKLEELTAAYLSKKTAEEVKASMTVLAKELKTTKNKVWGVVPLENDTYNLYAGMDPIITFMLFMKLRDKVPAESVRLIPYEHEVSRIGASMEHRGFLLDVGYTKKLQERYLTEQEE